MPEFNFTVEEDGDFYVMRVTGALGKDVISTARNQVDEMIEQYHLLERRNLNFIVDYAKAYDVDSATVGNILERMAFMAQNNHKIAFINVPERFKSIVEIHHVDGQIHFYDSEQEAREALINSRKEGS